MYVKELGISKAGAFGRNQTHCRQATAHEKQSTAPLLLGSEGFKPFYQQETKTLVWVSKAAGCYDRKVGSSWCSKDTDICSEQESFFNPLTLNGLI